MIWGWSKYLYWILGLFCVLGIGIFYRIQIFPLTQVYSDSLSPLVGSVRFWEQGVFQVANPESDHWLWMTTLPSILFAKTLKQAFIFRYAFNLMMIPCVMGMVSLATKSKDRDFSLFWGILSGVIIAVDSGVLDTLVSAFRGYFALEYMALAGLGVAFFEYGNPKQKKWGAWLSVGAMVIATGQHPLALGTLLGLGYLLYKIQSWDPQRLPSLLIFIMVLFIPRAWAVFELLQCETGGWSCIVQIASSSSEQIGILDQLQRLMHDRFWIEMGIAGPILLIGLLMGSQSILGKWLWISILGMLLLGLNISTLRPYHLRILSAPMVAVSVLGWSRIGRWSLATVPFWLWGMIIMPPQIQSWQNHMSVHDDIGQWLCTQQTAFWLEGYGDLEISIQGIGISYFLQGCSPEMVLPSANAEILVITQESLNYPHLYESDKFHLFRVPFIDIQYRLDQEKRLSGYDMAILFQDESNIVLK